VTEGGEYDNPVFEIFRWIRLMGCWGELMGPFDVESFRFALFEV
jgi:hypothetical protein